MKLIIEDDEGRKTVVPIVREEIEITIGRHEDNTIRLTERNVSRRHAKLLRKNGSVWVEDLGSYNGVRVNGDRIQGRIEIKEGDLIQIGDYDLAVQLDGVAKSDTLPSHAAVLAPAPEAHAHPAAPKEAGHANGGAAHAPAAPPKRAIEPTAVIHLDQVERTKRPVVDIPPEQAPKLVLVTTALAGREYACIRSELSIGRTDDNDIAIDHRSLSRNHCKIYREEDGTWKIVDLQSANGVKVNGEVYAQSPLKYGDVIELGHAKFQFLGPGEDSTAAQVRPSGRKVSGKLIGLLVGAAFIVGGGIAVVIVKTRPATLPVPPAAVPVAPAEPSLPPARASAPEPPPRPAVPSVSPGAHQQYELGLKYLGERKFEEAAKALQAAQEGGISEAEEQLKSAQEEVAAQQALEEAQDKLAKKDLDGARAALDRVPETSAFAADSRKLLDRIDKAAEKVEKPEKAEPPPKKSAAKESGKTSSKASAKPEKNGNGQDVQKYLDQAADLLRRQQPKEAAVFFEKVLQLDPTQARVHKYLGSAYSQIGDYNKAAMHYKKYIQAFPNAPDTPAIRENLRGYEDSLKGQSEGGE